MFEQAASETIEGMQAVLDDFLVGYNQRSHQSRGPYPSSRPCMAALRFWPRSTFETGVDRRLRGEYERLDLEFRAALRTVAAFRVALRRTRHLNRSRIGSSTTFAIVRPRSRASRARWAPYVNWLVRSAAPTSLPPAR